MLSAIYLETFLSSQFIGKYLPNKTVYLLNEPYDSRELATAQLANENKSLFRSSSFYSMTTKLMYMVQNIFLGKVACIVLSVCLHMCQVYIFANHTPTHTHTPQSHTQVLPSCQKSVKQLTRLLRITFLTWQCIHQVKYDPQLFGF